MLAHEWRELEVLCERISETRHRLVAAQRTQNSGLVEGLKDDLARARRLRELLVQHISARLSSVAASRPEPSDAALADGGSPAARAPTAELEAQLASLAGFSEK